MSNDVDFYLQGEFLSRGQMTYAFSKAILAVVVSVHRATGYRPQPCGDSLPLVHLETYVEAYEGDQTSALQHLPRFTAYYDYDQGGKPLCPVVYNLQAPPVLREAGLASLSFITLNDTRAMPDDSQTVTCQDVLDSFDFDAVKIAANLAPGPGRQCVATVLAPQRTVDAIRDHVLYAVPDDPNLLYYLDQPYAVDPSKNTFKQLVPRVLKYAYRGFTLSSRASQATTMLRRRLQHLQHKARRVFEAERNVFRRAARRRFCNI